MTSIEMIDIFLAIPNWLSIKFNTWLYKDDIEVILTDLDGIEYKTYATPTTTCIDDDVEYSAYTHPFTQVGFLFLKKGGTILNSEDQYIKSWRKNEKTK